MVAEASQTGKLPRIKAAKINHGWYIMPDPNSSVPNIRDKKILEGLAKAYNENCERISFLLGNYHLQILLSKKDSSDDELKKLFSSLEEKGKKGDKKAKADAEFIQDQIEVLNIYKVLYLKQEERRRSQEEAKRKKAEEKAKQNQPQNQNQPPK